MSCHMPYGIVSSMFMCLIYHTSYVGVICHASCVMCRIMWSYVMCHVSYVICHMPYAICHGYVSCDVSSRVIRRISSCMRC
jgi:hypothetical protein